MVTCEDVFMKQRDELLNYHRRLRLLISNISSCFVLCKITVLSFLYTEKSFRNVVSNLSQTVKKKGQIPMFAYEELTFR